MNRLIPVVCFALFGFANGAEDLLQWINKEGKTLEASFVAIDGKLIRFKTKDGKAFTYPMANLSLDSQAQAMEMEKRAAALREVAHLPEHFRNRCGVARRTNAIETAGGEMESLDAVRKALDWLARQQNADGSLGKVFPAGVTGLALLAYLGHCETTSSSTYGEAVTNAALYLMNRAMENDGFIHNGESGMHQSYEHAIATYALAELLTMTRETARPIPKLDSTVKKSVNLIIDGQTGMGGWTYGYNRSGSDDLSLAGWHIQALDAAQHSGEDFRDLAEALEKATNFVMQMQDDRGSFKYRPSQPQGKPSLTGAGLYSLQLRNGASSPVYDKGIAYLSEAYSRPAPTGSFYAHYYNTLVFFGDGGEAWKAYHDQFMPKLIAAQNSDGSWDAVDAEKDKAYLNTAWAALMLEVYYRYNPAAPGAATR